MRPCERPEGHEWQLLTRHPDPPGYEGVLPNAICAHCEDQAYIEITNDEDAERTTREGGAS